MSIETHIPQDDIDIKQLNIEQPEQGDVYFDEQKFLSNAIWEKFKEERKIKLDKYLAEPDAHRRELNLRAYASEATDYYFLSAKKARELPTNPAIDAIKDREFHENMAQGKWSRVVSLMINYLIKNPEKLLEMKLTDEQYRELANRAQGEFKQKAIQEGDWDDYLSCSILFKYIYPNEPDKWLEIEPETLAQAKETFSHGDGDAKLMLKLLLPGPTGDYTIPKESRLGYFQELIEAKRKQNWDKYHDAALKFKLAEAEEINFTPQGIEVKVRVPESHVGTKSPTLPEVKKF